MVKVSSQAFADREMKPSFFRRKYTNEPPYSNPPRLNSSDAVVMLTVHQIRYASVNQSIASPNSLTASYSVDICADPFEGQHRSHATVVSIPETIGSNAFKKLKERLAGLVNDFAVPPDVDWLKLHHTYAGKPFLNASLSPVQGKSDTP